MHALVATLLGLGLTAAPVPKVKEREKTVEEKVVGTWKLVKSDIGLNEGTFEAVYEKGGAMKFVHTADGTKTVSTGKYKAGEPDEKYPLGSIDWTVKEGDDERGEVSKIIKLTATELVIEDPDGVKEYFERVVEEKKDK